MDDQLENSTNGTPEPPDPKTPEEKSNLERKAATKRTRLEELMALVAATHIDDLETAIGVLGLTNNEAAQMFGVSRQAFGKWLIDGPPRKRLPDVGAFVDTERLLVDMIKPERIPMVMRRKAPSYDNKSLIDIATTESISAMYQAAYDSLDLRRVMV